MGGCRLANGIAVVRFLARTDHLMRRKMAVKNQKMKKAESNEL
jgi:hypothetical protein